MLGRLKGMKMPSSKKFEEEYDSEESDMEASEEEDESAEEESEGEAPALDAISDEELIAELQRRGLAEEDAEASDMSEEEAMDEEEY